MWLQQMWKYSFFLVSWFCFQIRSKFQGKHGNISHCFHAQQLSYSFLLLLVLHISASILIFLCVYLYAGRHLSLWVHKYKYTPCVWQLKNSLQCYSLETLNPIVSQNLGGLETHQVGESSWHRSFPRLSLVLC